MMHPVGPQSAQTYWVRRVIVALVAIALVVGLTWWMVARGSSGTTDAATTSTEQTTEPPELTGVLAAEPPAGLGDVSLEFDGDDSAADAGDETDGKAGGATDGETIGDTADEPDTTATNAGNDAAAADTSADAGSSTGSSSAAATATAPTTAASGSATSDPSAPAASPPATDGADPTIPPATVVETTMPGTVTVTVTKQVPVSGAQPATPTTTAPPAPSYDANGTLICPDTSIRVTATVLASSLFVGAQPRLGMTVTNIGQQRCVRDVSGSLQIYTVYRADGTRVWSTDDCFPGTGHETRVLAPGKSASYVIKWAGTSSTPKTCTPRSQVKAGDYTLVAQLGALKSKPLPFTMR